MTKNRAFNFSLAMQNWPNRPNLPIAPTTKNVDWKRVSKRYQKVSQKKICPRYPWIFLGWLRTACLCPPAAHSIGNNKYGKKGCKAPQNPHRDAGNREKVNFIAEVSHFALDFQKTWWHEYKTQKSNYITQNTKSNSEQNDPTTHTGNAQVNSSEAAKERLQRVKLRTSDLEG